MSAAGGTGAGPTAPPGGDAVTFAERLLHLLEATFSDTYEHAILLALMDAASSWPTSRAWRPESWRRRTSPSVYLRLHDGVPCGPRQDARTGRRREIRRALAA